MSRAPREHAIGRNLPRCEMHAWSQDWHLSQVYTGFASLAAGRRIDLHQKCLRWDGPDASRPQHLRNARAMHVRVIVNDSLRLYFDTHDAPEIDEPAAGEADLYFKRSYMPGAIPAHLMAKVRPLGLNYAVYPDRFDRFELGRALADLDSLGAKAALLSALVLRGMDMRAVSLGHRPTVAAMQAPPRPHDAPRVLFMARAWDPADQPDRERPQREERAEINEMRAQCVRMLRREFGSAFSGGLKHTPYALDHYRDVLLDEPASASKRSYLELLAAHPICISTTGLHGSIGWKFGEYVAFSKAIVSEKLLYSVPGDLAAGKHYLEFRTADDCVAAAVELFKDAQQRASMMLANQAYYQRYVRPDMMIANALEQALHVPI